MILRDHEVFSVAFSRDGARIVTGEEGNTVRVWNANTGKERLAIGPYGPDNNVYAAAFSPDGTKIVSGGTDSTAHIWDIQVTTVTDHDLIVEACTRRLRGLSSLRWEEMRLLGEPDAEPPIDVCHAVH